MEREADSEYLGPNPFADYFECDNFEWFKASDDFNNQLIEGSITRQEGEHFGSILIREIAGVTLPQLICGFPRQEITTPVALLASIAASETKPHSFIIVKSFEGIPIQLYKYSEPQNGRVLVAARLRGGAPSLLDCAYGPFRSLLCEALKCPTLSNGDFDKYAYRAFPALEDESVQAVNCILTGKKVKRFHPYEYNAADVVAEEVCLQPHSVRYHDRTVGPVLKRGENAMIVPFTSDALQAACLQLNGFGASIFLLDANKKVLFLTPSKSIPRIPPTSWLTYDEKDLARKARECAFAVRMNCKKWTLDAIRQDCPLLSSQFKLHAKEITAAVKQFLASDPFVPQCIVLIGIPCSGKSTFSKTLIEKDASWRHVNQDELKTRKHCKAAIERALDCGMNLIIDRCNQDVPQRKGWIDEVRKYGVHSVYAVFLDVDPSVCKARVMKRQNHPTLPAVERSKDIIDEFAGSLMKPHLNEGFKDAIVIRTEKDFKNCMDRFSLKK